MAISRKQTSIPMAGTLLKLQLYHNFMDPAEVEFIAEQETISIIPKFTDQRVIHLISGDIGPFRAGIPVPVPLWVAIHLRQRKKCTIIAPDWMDLEVLEAKLEEEKSSKFFTKMPNEHYIGIAHLLFGVAARDVDNAESVRTAIKDLWDLRISKARSSADTFIKGGGRHAGIDHLTQMEISTLRPLFLDALDTTYRLTATLEDASFLNTSSFVSQTSSSTQSN